MIINLIIYLL